MITHLEPDILEYKVNWALESITTNKASEGDGIPAELFQILKDDAARSMPANMEHSAVVIGSEKVSFYSNHKEEQCQRMFKLPHNCTHFTYQQSNAQNYPSQASTVHEPRTSRCTSWIKKRQRNYWSNGQNLWITEKARKF